MNTLSYGTVSIHFISVALSLICLMITLKNHHRRGAYELSVVLILAIIASIATTMEITSSTFEERHLWRNILQIGLFILPAATLNFVRKYTNDHTRWLKVLNTVAFFYQIIAVVLIFTNDYHHIMRESVEIIQHGDELYLLVKQTLFGKIVGALNTLVNIAAIILLAIFSKKCSGYIQKSSRRETLCCKVTGKEPCNY